MTVKKKEGTSEDRSYEAIPGVIMASNLNPHDLVYAGDRTVNVQLHVWLEGRSGWAAGGLTISTIKIKKKQKDHVK